MRIFIVLLLIISTLIAKKIDTITLIGHYPDESGQAEIKTKLITNNGCIYLAKFEQYDKYYVKLFYFDKRLQLQKEETVNVDNKFWLKNGYLNKNNEIVLYGYTKNRGGKGVQYLHIFYTLDSEGKVKQRHVLNSIKRRIKLYPMNGHKVLIVEFFRTKNKKIFYKATKLDENFKTIWNKDLFTLSHQESISVNELNKEYLISYISRTRQKEYVKTKESVLLQYIFKNKVFNEITLDKYRGELRHKRAIKIKENISKGMLRPKSFLTLNVDKLFYLRYDRDTSMDQLCFTNKNLQHTSCTNINERKSFSRTLFKLSNNRIILFSTYISDVFDNNVDSYPTKYTPENLKLKGLQYKIFDENMQLLFSEKLTGIYDKSFVFNEVLEFGNDLKLRVKGHSYQNFIFTIKNFSKK